MDHLLGVVFALPSPNPLQKALDHSMYVSPEDFITETDKTLEDLKYPDDNGALVTIPSGTSSLLKSLKQFVAYQVSQGVTFDEDDWAAITQKDI